MDTIKDMTSTEPSIMETIKSTVADTKSKLENSTNSIKNSVNKSVNSMNPFSEKAETKMPMANSNEKSQTQEVLDKFSLGTSKSNVLGVTSEQSGLGTWAIRLGLLFIILLLLGVNLITYMHKGKDLFSDKLRELASTNGNSFFDSVENSFDNAVAGTSFGAGVIGDSFKSLINLLRRAFTFKEEEKKEEKKKTDKPGEIKKLNKTNDVDKALKKQKNNKNVNPDSSKSEIQQPKSGICYVGYQTPHNACLQIDDVKKCISGKIFNSMEDCKNYNPN